MTTTGTTSTGAVWSFVTEKSQRYLLLTGPNGEQEKQSLSSSQLKRLVAYPETLNYILEILTPILLSGEASYPISKFAGLKTLTRDHFLAIDKLDDAWLKVAALNVYMNNPNVDAATAERIAKIQVSLADSRNDVDSYYLDLHVTVQRTDLSEWLDMWDFIINGEPRETYKHFNDKNSGRAFPVKYGLVTTNSRTRVEYRGDHLALSRVNVSQIAHRFIQLSRRSQKLKKKLHTMPLEKIIQALDFNISGTLLVTDTMELIDSLKHVRLRGERTYSSTNVDMCIGLTLANKARRAHIEDDLAKYFGHRYESVIITDLYGVWYHYAALAPFITHAARKLGVEETLRMLQTIESETEGVTMRGWMELVRLGGFPKDQPAGWTALMLADK